MPKDGRAGSSGSKESTHIMPDIKKMLSAEVRCPNHPLNKVEAHGLCFVCCKVKGLIPKPVMTEETKAWIAKLSGYARPQTFRSEDYAYGEGIEDHD